MVSRARIISPQARAALRALSLGESRAHSSARHRAAAVPRLACTAALAALLSVVGMSTAPELAGQATRDPRLTVGRRVRVEWMESIRRRRAVGTVGELRTDSLTLMQPAGARTFALARLHRIDVRVPRSRARAAARGAGLGLLAGVAVGLAVGAYSATAGCHPRNDMCGLALLGGPVFGAMAGLPLGAIIGAGSPGQRWQRVR